MLVGCPTLNTWHWRATSCRTSPCHTHWHSAGGFRHCYSTTTCLMHCPAFCYVCQHWALCTGMETTTISSRRSCGTTLTLTSASCVCKAVPNFRRHRRRHIALVRCSSGLRRQSPDLKSTSSHRRWLRPLCAITLPRCTASSMSAAIATRQSLLIYQVGLKLNSVTKTMSVLHDFFAYRMSHVCPSSRCLLFNFFSDWSVIFSVTCLVINCYFKINWLSVVVLLLSIL